jgi:hypothetical protein
MVTMGEEVDRWWQHNVCNNLEILLNDEGYIKYIYKDVKLMLNGEIN